MHASQHLSKVFLHEFQYNDHQNQIYSFQNIKRN